ncbi:LysR family transcriptional regulator [Scandinavium sp. NPDC088450]|uniref:LysR family transcriptional regulator n=1 Tax=Scandinavium sp. NPDC088450 TaxID=3364514 RepID=UPI00384C7BC3
MDDLVDLKTLEIIHILVRTQSIAKAALEKGIKPGAISYILNKARKVTGQVLFVRTKNGMIPDATATKMSEHYFQLTNRRIMNGENSSAQKRQVVYHRAFSLMEIMSTSQILKDEYDYQALHSYQPQTNCNEERLADLKSFKVNMDVGAKLPPDPAIHQIKLFSSRVSIILNKQHGYRQDRLTLDEWLASKHVVRTSLSDYYCDNAIKASDSFINLNKRNVVMTSGSHINMVAFCSSTDCIMLAPDFYILSMMDSFPVTYLKTPPEIELKYDCYMHIHAGMAEDKNIMIQIDEIIRDFNSYADAHFSRENGIISLR